MGIFEKMKKIWKFINFQVQITFFLFVVWKKRKYESDAKFYEVFENQHRGTQKMTRTPELVHNHYVAKMAILSASNSKY